MHAVKLPVVADAFYAKKMTGPMLLDRGWTPRDMEHDLSHPTEGMGISNAQFRARASAFVKALREKEGGARRARVTNYYKVWREQDGVGDEERELEGL